MQNIKRSFLNTEQLKNAEDNVEGTGFSSFSEIENINNVLGGFYSPEINGANTSRRIRKIFLGTKTRRNTTIGGGITGILVGAVLFIGAGIATGPLQFVHIAQLLRQFHFANLEDAGNDRTVKLFRFVRYNLNGENERTRLGMLGNKLADTIESQMKTTGIESAYTSKFGNFDGYVIDPSNEHFKGMSKQQIKQYFKDSYNVELSDGTGALDGKLVASAEGLGYFQNRGMIQAMMSESGFSDISSTLGSRIMGKRAALSWHPLSNLDTKLQNALEDWWNGYKSNIEEGSTPEITTTEGNQPSNDTATEGNTAQGLVAEGQSAASSGSLSSFEALKGSIGFKIGAGSAAAIGVLCLARGIAANFSTIKQSEVVLPLIRTGMEAIIVGNQVMDGQDVNLSELGKLSQQFTNSKGQSWEDAQSIQSEEDKPLNGVAPTGTISSVGAAPPFSSLANNSVLGGFCSTPIQIGATVIGFLGGPVTAAVTTIIGAVASKTLLPVFENDLANFLIGKAINPDTLNGPDYGNAINYGSRLAADQQGIAAGGVPLTTAQSAQLSNTENIAENKQFGSKSLAYRIFNPYDNRTVASHIINSISPNFTQNIASIFSDVIHAGGNLFADIGSLFTSTIHASTNASYNYGFPEIGFSEQDLNDPLVENPYENANAVATLLDNYCLKSDGTVNSDCSYITSAAQCFGVQLTKNQETDANGNSVNVWDIADSGSAVSLDNDTQANCGDNSSLNTNLNGADCSNLTNKSVIANPYCSPWLRIRFFIFDTENMNSVGCYENDTTSCNDIYMDNSTGSTVGLANLGAAKQLIDTTRIALPTVG